MELILFSEGYRRYLALGLTSSVRVFLFLFFCDAARRRQTLYDVARLLLIAPIDPWRNLVRHDIGDPFIKEKVIEVDQLEERKKIKG